VDTGAAVARELKRRADAEIHGRVLLGVAGEEEFYTSGDAEQASRIMSVLWGKAVAVQRLPAEAA